MTVAELKKPGLPEKVRDEVVERVKDDELALPSDPQTIFLGGLFILALFTAIYFTGEILLPFVLAFVLSLLLQPAVHRLVRLHVPKILAAALLIVAVFGLIVGIGTAVSGPAANWAAKLPEGIPRIQEKLSFLKGPIDTVERFLRRVEDASPTATVPAPAAGTTTVVAAAPSDGLAKALFTGTRDFASGFLTMILFLFFLLSSGDMFLRRIVEAAPRLSDKKVAVDISQQIQADISVYLTTITIMNAVVGVLTGFVTWVTGLGDPVLWGAVAFLLNYVPILGWLTNVVVLLLAGMLTFDTIGQALLPAGLYLAIHIAEGETVTPVLLARRFTLNPVIVVLSLVFWFWMWGVAGAIVAVPMLAITKIICDRVRSLAVIGHFLGGDDPTPHTAGSEAVQTRPARHGFFARFTSTSQ